MVLLYPLTKTLMGRGRYNVVKNDDAIIDCINRKDYAVIR